jgi:hypothetical protein
VTGASSKTSSGHFMCILTFESYDVCGWEKLHFIAGIG